MLRVCETLVGLGDVHVLGATEPDRDGSPLLVDATLRADQGWRGTCGVKVQVKNTTAVVLVDMTCFGRPARLVWHKQLHTGTTIVATMRKRESLVPVFRWTQPAMSSSTGPTE